VVSVVSGLTVQDSTASFYVGDYGLEDRFVHFWRGTTFLGTRQIASNTATVLTLTSAVSGLVAGDTYIIGPVSWTWRTKMFELPDRNARNMEMHCKFALQGESPITQIFLRDYVNGAAQSRYRQDVRTEGKTFPIHASGQEYELEVHGHTSGQQVAIRSLTLETLAQRREKP
jgi:hypothetical protein